ncbi:hypothetical protein HDU96_008110, partial [Phlyctochytrium bullatum]
MGNTLSLGNPEADLPRRLSQDGRQEPSESQGNDFLQTVIFPPTLTTHEVSEERGRTSQRSPTSVNSSKLADPILSNEGDTLKQSPTSVAPPSGGLFLFPASASQPSGVEVNDDTRRSSLTMVVTTSGPRTEVPIITGQLLMTGAMAAADTIMDASMGVSKMLWTVAMDVSQAPMALISRLSRPMLNERWASLSDFRVGSMPSVVTKIASYLPPREVWKARAVSRCWYESLEGMVRASQVWVTLVDPALLDLIRASQAGDRAPEEHLGLLEDRMIKFALVGYYTVQSG